MKLLYDKLLCSNILVGKALYHININSAHTFSEN